MNSMLRSLWDYRYFIFSSIRNDYVVRFSRSKVGLLWMIVHPLVQVLIYALVLSEVLSAKFHGIDSKYAYAVYLMSGMLCWSLFSELINKLVGVFTENAEQIKKISFPKICLAAIAIGVSLINNGLLLVGIFFIFASLGYLPGHYVAWLPVLMLVTTMLATGIGLILGVLNVFVRDVSQVVPVVLQVLYWLTPIVYGVEMLGDGARDLVESNPLYPLVASFQNVIAFNRSPDLEGLALLVLGAMVLGAVALLLFRRASAEMADVL